MSLVCVAGLIAACFRKQKNHLLWLMLIPGVSYYLTFISVILYHYDRFFLPICILLALFGGRFLADCRSVSGVRFHRVKMVLFSLLIGYTFYYAFSIDILMANDSRYAVEKWMRQHASAQDFIGLVGHVEYLPRMGSFARKHYLLKPLIPALAAVKPDYLILNADIKYGEREFYTRLETGASGYTLVLQYRTDVKWLLLNRDSIFSNGRKEIFTNLDKINPEIKVFKKNL